jgi:hypothetical protein
MRKHSNVPIYQCGSQGRPGKKRLSSADCSWIRSSFRDWASENGHPNDLAERTLAHSFRSVIEAAYHRTGLLEPRRMMMLQWEIIAFNTSVQTTNVAVILRQSE